MNKTVKGLLRVRCNQIKLLSAFYRFATKEPNGLLLYNGRFNEKHDFIAMEIINEQIQLTFSAGRTPVGLPIYHDLLKRCIFFFVSWCFCLKCVAFSHL